MTFHIGINTGGFSLHLALSIFPPIALPESSPRTRFLWITTYWIPNACKVDCWTYFLFNHSFYLSNLPQTFIKDSEPTPCQVLFLQHTLGSLDLPYFSTLQASVHLYTVPSVWTSFPHLFPSSLSWFPAQAQSSHSFQKLSLIFPGKDLPSPDSPQHCLS